MELIVAELAPQPDVPSVVRKLPSARPAVRAASLPAVEPTPAVMPVSQAMELPRATAPQVTTPLSPGRYKVQFTATQALYDKLQRLKDLMRHQIPDGDLSAIVERAADLLIEQRMKRRFAQTKRKPRVEAPAAERSQSPSRYIRRAVVREVHARDGGQCTFVSPEGRRCQSLGFLELHHEKPHARAGLPTPGNMKLLCRAHNALLAERDFGRPFMQERLRRVRRGVEGLGLERSSDRDRSREDPARLRRR